MLLNAITAALLLPCTLGYTLAPAFASHTRVAVVMCGPTYDPSILEKCMAMKVSELKAEL